MKPKFKIQQCVLLLVCLFCGSQAVKAQQKALYFPENQVNAGASGSTPATGVMNFADLDTTLNTALATGSFTVEMWLKCGAGNVDNPAIIGNKNWNAGANLGWVLSYYAPGATASGAGTDSLLAFSFSPNGSEVTRTYIAYPPQLANSWTHVAVSVNRSGTIQLYLNGVLTNRLSTAANAMGATTTAVDISSRLGQSVNTNSAGYSIKLGADGKPAGYRAPFEGGMDEVRIWTTPRPVDSIRKYMCRKLAGNETDLLVYYNMDTDTDTTVVNRATATAGQYNGKIQRTVPHVVSGAAVGDTSVYLYTTNWAGQSLQLATANRGVFTVDSFGTTTGSFLQLYKVNAVPDSTRGLISYSNNDVSFGAFASGDNFVYYPKYDYTNYANANTYQSAITFFNRRYNDDLPWTYKNFVYRNTAAKLTRIDSVRGTRQFFLGNFINSCGSTPSALTVTNILPSSAELNWTSSAAVWNLQIGPNTWTTISGVGTKPYTLTGLQPNTTYSYYVKDSCLHVGSSSWVGPYSFTTAPSYANFGSGYAMKSSSTGVQAFNLGKALSDSLATTNFTVEMWVKVDPTGNTNNPAIFGTKNWTAGANTGIAWSFIAPGNTVGGGPANGFRFNFATTAGSSSRKDVDMTPANAFTWNHYAITVDRAGTIKGYINGVLKTTSASIAANLGQSIASNLPAHIAQDGTGNFAAKLNGSIDEVRIWKTARTEQELRDNMCQKLDGNEAGLLAYYGLNEVPGSTTITNGATATTGMFNGTATATPPAFVISGAPLGDTSVALYTNNWVGQSLELPAANRGTFIVDSFSATGTHLHLYRVNNVPNYTSGLTSYANNNVQFGVFDGNDSFSYYPKYTYGNYDSAVYYKKTLYFFTRDNNAETSWAGKTNLYNDTALRIIRTDSVEGTKQFFLANFQPSICVVPTALSVSNVAGTSAQINWTAGGAALWNIQYGASGFTPGNGTIIRAVNSNPYTLGNLQGNTAYDVYVQDTCVGTGASAWVGPIAFTTLVDYAGMGSGYALRFNGNSTLNGPVHAVNLGTALQTELDTTSFTIEMWLKIGTATGAANPAFISNKDWTSGANTGISWCFIHPAGPGAGGGIGGGYRFNFRPANGTRRDYDMKPNNAFTWNHVAMTVNRSGMLQGYVNGVPMGTPINISADAGLTLAGVLPMYLGTDGTGKYRYPLNGDMDEVRIWKRVLDSTEIRANMCQKLQGNENGLLVYYRLNESPGSTTAINNANVTAGLYNGTHTATPSTYPLVTSVISGAPVGDTSVFVYPTAGWNGISLSLGSNGKGLLIVDSVTAVSAPGSNPPAGVHIYRIDKAPNDATGIANMGGTDKFFGVFTAENASAYYRTRYDFSGYPDAVANVANLHLYNRPHNAAPRWTQLPAVKNGNVIARTGFLGTRQYLLADFNVVPSCIAPANISIDSLSNVFAGLSWTSAAAMHITKFGKTGFDMDTVVASVRTVNNQSFAGLSPNTYYDFYIQDSCGAGNKSAWVGPYTFATEGDCPAPVNVHAANVKQTSLDLVWTDLGTVTSSYGISWGEQGSFTDPANGTYLAAFGTNQPFTGLKPNTTYVFYIKIFCNSALTPTSGWVGPFSFTTADPASVTEINAGKYLAVYPNPAKDRIVVSIEGNNAAGINSIVMVNNLGAVVYERSVAAEKQIEINTASMPSGVYFISVQSAEGRFHKKVIISQ